MTKTNQSTETSARGNGKPKLPTHVAKVRHGYGKKATYERIGVAWRNDDGSLYVKLAGTQMVSAADALRAGGQGRRGGRSRPRR